MQSYDRGHSLSWTAERLEAALWAPALAYPSTDAKTVAGPWHTCRQVALLPARTLRTRVAPLPKRASCACSALAVGSRSRRRVARSPSGRSASHVRSARAARSARAGRSLRSQRALRSLKRAHASRSAPRRRVAPLPAHSAHSTRVGERLCSPHSGRSAPRARSARSARAGGCAARRERPPGLLPRQLWQALPPPPRLQQLGAHCAHGARRRRERRRARRRLLRLC